MKKLVSVGDYKVSVALQVDQFYIEKFGLPAKVYRVPLQKNYRNIKPDYGNLSDKDGVKIGLGELGNPSYNGSVRYNLDTGYCFQYRDGCFYPYIGRLAF